MIRIDAAWLATTPLDMRAGTDTALSRVIAVFGAAYPHHAYLFANKRANRIKILVHDGIGIWLAARRLHQGKFIWPLAGSSNLTLQRQQLDALVMGLPWQRLADGGVITVV
ncbi:MULTISPECIES: IS66 family insertion sequence element accessory protein TnpB [Acidovorax]|uniref:IS66 family insertion sequence element accessory protein TnpB n=1 Tax=Acidovorax TaxID=12916 RepID=UPI00023777E0|nr:MULTISPECIES: IS66 family insertion sequence element accessory protein TnpB [Acidovorax]KRD26478.1 transposase [Acidovorax sp. Root267]